VVLGSLAVAALLAVVVLVVRSQTPSAEPSTVAPRPQGTSPQASQVQLPTISALETAKLFAARRAGRVSFAVVDTSGALACYRCRSSYHSASIVKAMLLVSYLHQVSRSGEPLPADHEAYLESMIRRSDNDAATAIYAHVGDKGLSELAAQAQMADFRVSGSWGSAQITAADQARFFADLDVLTASEYRDLVLALLTSISQEQSWGIPEAARPEWQTFFKGGWLTHEDGSLVHQVARLSKNGSAMTIAVLTDGNPNDEYGRETIRGIADRLLGH
jgi:beta-lactamase class A